MATRLEGYHYIIFCWLFFGITTPFVLIRLYVQLWFRNRPWRECFTVLAYLLLMGGYITQTVQLGADVMNQWIDPATIPYENWQRAEIAFWATGFLYYPCLYCCKAALLCFYGDLTPRQYFPKTSWAITATWVWIGIGAGFQILFPLLGCWPFHKNFEPGSKCSRNFALWTTTWCLHMFTDILVYLIPFVILGNLNFDKKKMRSAYAMFGVGTLNIIAAVTTILNTLIANSVALQSWTWAWVISYIMSFQVATAVIIICMPHVRRFWMGTSIEAMRPELKNAPKHGGGTTDGHTASRSAAASPGAENVDLEQGMKAGEVILTKEMKGGVGEVIMEMPERVVSTGTGSST